MSGYRAALLANLHRAARKHENKGQDGRLRVRKDKVLDAVAFQDHLTRSLDFRFPKSMSRSNSLKKEGGTWTCNRCTLTHNSNTRQNCRACGTKRQRRRDDVTDLQYERKLTLAMKRGLVKPPPPKLTEKEWDSIESQSKTRHQDSCPICREQFKLSEQVILSCGHVFHRQCLRSFERFVRSSKRSCPICRKQNCTSLIFHNLCLFNNTFNITYKHICRSKETVYRGCENLS